MYTFFPILYWKKKKSKNLSTDLKFTRLDHRILNLRDFRTRRPTTWDYGRTEFVVWLNGLAYLTPKALTALSDSHWGLGKPWVQLA